MELFAIPLLAICAWAVCSPRVQTGIIVTIGLLAIVIACLGSFDDWVDIRRLFLVLVIGNLLVAGGMLYRGYISRRIAKTQPNSPLRRAADWWDVRRARH
jgi:hypothetical protein